MPRSPTVASGPIDPWYRIEGSIVVRRLSPNNRKIEAVDNLSALLSSDMLEAMGLDLANLHSGSEGRAAAIKEDLGKRKPGWLGRECQGGGRGNRQRVRRVEGRVGVSADLDLSIAPQGLFEIWSVAARSRMLSAILHLSQSGVRPTCRSAS